MSAASLVVHGLGKTFRLAHRGGIELPVLSGFDLTLGPGECVVLIGPSGIGKSTVLRCVYGNYLPGGGHILVRHGGRLIDLVGAHHRTMMEVRRRTLGYVSQFLRAVPRVPTLDVVADPLLRLGVAVGAARARAAELLERLGLPERLWSLPPQTFSGGEQQRVNIARGFAVEYPVLLLDEPTAALDAANRSRVAALIDDAKQRGAAVLGIFHDLDFADAVGTRFLRMAAAER
ncbi:MAG: phosphonate C-P lyase system protein PhnL [Alphaproteobacteria bacterium]|nr:phosphonate C-P lyase system protein PhnL [Alphaproteobacteria bacterium]